MPSEYKLLIFDWDGTLADSIGRIVTSMQGLRSAQVALSVMMRRSKALLVWGCRKRF